MGLDEKVTLKARVQKDFTYHAVGTGKAQLMADLREAFRLAAEAVVAVVPPGRELHTALTKLEEVMFWANAGIARDGK